MALINLQTILTTMLALLQADPTTKDIHWHYGFMPMDMIQNFDNGAGCVTVLSLSDISLTVPSKRQINAEFGIVLYVKSDAGVEPAERALQDMLDNVLQVLAGSRNFGLPYVMLNRAPRIEMSSNATREAQIAWCLLHLECIIVV